MWNACKRKSCDSRPAVENRRRVFGARDRELRCLDGALRCQAPRSTSTPFWGTNLYVKCPLTKFATSTHCTPSATPFPTMGSITQLFSYLLFLVSLPLISALKFDVQAHHGHESANKERCIRNFVAKDQLVVVTANVDGYRGDGQQLNMHVRGITGESTMIYFLMTSNRFEMQ